MSDLQTATPNGTPVVFDVRDNTNDHNTVNSICVADEYELRGVTELTGWALDLGAHVGGVSICLAVDNPGLREVVAVEPVPQNAALVREHAARNGVSERVVVREMACGAAGTSTLIRYGFRDAAGEIDHHAWIGNSSLVYKDAPVEDHEEREVECIDLLELRDFFGEPPAFVKVDCEGGEWPALAQIVELGGPFVIGEWHPVLGHDRVDPLVAAFEEAGYHLRTSGPAGGPGLFVAER